MLNMKLKKIPTSAPMMPAVMALKDLMKYQIALPIAR
jgi:hypothetical protein